MLVVDDHLASRPCGVCACADLVRPFFFGPKLTNLYHTPGYEGILCPFWTESPLAYPKNPPLCPYGIAYRRTYRESTSRLFKKSF